MTGIHSEIQLKSSVDRKELQFVTGASGFSKSLSKPQGPKKWTFGDDAYFIARDKVADVIGKCHPWYVPCISHVIGLIFDPYALVVSYNVILTLHSSAVTGDSEEAAFTVQ